VSAVKDNAVFKIKNTRAKIFARGFFILKTASLP